MEIEHFLKAFVNRFVADLQQLNSQTYENAANSILLIKKNPENAEILQVLSVFTNKSIEEILDGIQTTAKEQIAKRTKYKKGYRQNG